MTDQLEMLFADARAEALARVRPPGTAAARQTLHRRRITKSATAGVAVLIIAGVAMNPSRDDRPVQPAGPPGILAAKAIGLDPDAPHLGAVQAITAWGPTHTGGDVIGGRYEAKVACVGTGDVTVTFEAIPSGISDSSGPNIPIYSRTVEVSCGEIAGTASTPVLVDGSAGTVTVRIDPDSDAIGQATVAYRLTLTEATRAQLQTTATTLVNESAAGAMVASWSDVLDSDIVNRDETMGPGRYRARAACVGAGVAVVAVTAVTDEAKGKRTRLANGTVTCTAQPSAVPLPFTVPAAGVQAVDVAVSPGTGAHGQAAVAIRVDRD